jgi:hypothetical protein
LLRAIAIGFLVLSGPAFAQNHPECRGKEMFDLGGDAYGCMRAIEKSSVISSQRRGIGSGSLTVSRNETTSATIGVYAFGKYTDNFQKSNARLRQICKMYKGAAHKMMAGQDYKNISVILFWPELKTKGNWGQVVEKTQGGSMNLNCKQLRNFGSYSSS